MQLIPSSVLHMLELLRARQKDTDFEETLGQNVTKPLPPRIRARQASGRNTLKDLWRQLQAQSQITEEQRSEIADQGSLERAKLYSGNIENFIGTTKVPVGVIGPLRVNGLNAMGDYFVPLATSEAALVASYGRGAEITAKAGGISTAMIAEGVLRTPAFVFDSMVQSGRFIDWIVDNADDLKSAAEQTTRFGKLVGIEPYIDSDVVFLMCRYTTGDASGQNMVTLATEALFTHIMEHTPVVPLHAFIEANFSGDKKASFLGMHRGRGRKTTASVEIPKELIRRHLRVQPEKMMAYGRIAALGATMSGQLGAQAHYANGLAAFYIATGQDAACVSESAVGFTRMEEREDRIFFSVTMPNILVGSVGGGTGLPSQSAALDLMGLRGAGKAAALAEIAAALCLCGEISIIAAIAAGHFTRAHAKLARTR